MNALVILFAGHLVPEAFEPLFDNKSSISLAVEQAQKFPGAAKTVILSRENVPPGGARLDAVLPRGVTVESRPSWTKKSLLEALSNYQEGFDFTYFAWIDCPFLDPVLAGSIAERHIRYAAEYSYADGWPCGLAPELLSPGTAAILLKILGDDDGEVGRDALFSVIQKDINAFDIETEISTVDLRCHRLTLASDSKRNLLLLRRFSSMSRAIPDTTAIEKIIAEHPEILRTLPNFYPIQVYSGCPQTCAVCPYPKVRDPLGRTDFMETAKFESLLEKIMAFSGEAVIDLSLWGELALHPQKMDLIKMVLDRPPLSLLIETSGVGWKAADLERCAEFAGKAALSAHGRKSPPPLSWIISLDTLDPRRYREIRGNGFACAMECAKKLLDLFPKDAYVQSVRTAGAEDDIENFYRTWKKSAGAENIIIQKYNDFCGFLPRKQASDLSPVKRQPCWHLMRDMPVLLDGTVPLCFQNLEAVTAEARGLRDADERVMGNVFAGSLEEIWERGTLFYLQQCEKKYESCCAVCDEYYTYNF